MTYIYEQKSHNFHFKEKVLTPLLILIPLTEFRNEAQKLNPVIYYFIKII